LTFANLITFLRFVLVPAIIYALLTGHNGFAFAGFIVAGISDGIDGFVARHYNQRSELGTYLDPLADKLLLVSVFVVLGLMEELPLWLVVMAVSRDLLIICAVLLSAVMGHPVEMRPLPVSKANTAVQIVLAALVLAELAFATSIGLAREGLVIVSGVLTAASTAAYFVSWLRHMGGYAKSGQE
jgi:cardiolipin synthase